jgi:hypothetical protein
MPGLSTTEDTAPTRRSNRPLTQFACRLTEDFLLGKLEPKKYIIHNTTVDCTETKSSTTLAVKLFSTQILTVSLALPTEEPLHVSINVGDKFTNAGHPTKTSIERLNGLLDSLGIHGIIPEGVRIFKDFTHDMFYLGKGDDKIAVGEKYAHNVSLKPDSFNFIVEASDLPAEKLK